MATGVLKKYSIRELEPYAPQLMVVGLIICKQRTRKFIAKSDQLERAVWGFTLRDSPMDYINVSCWGDPDTLFRLSDKFQIGDVVQIQNPRVEIRNVNDPGENYNPMVTSPYKLSVNTNEGYLVQVTDGYFDLKRLLHIPTKPIEYYVTLANIHSNIKGLNGQTVDILVAVRSVGEIRPVSTRFGQSQVRDVVVFDYTHPGLTITLWDSDYFIRAGLWKPRLTILFMTDIKVSYNTYSRSASGTVTGRSVITENPVSREGDDLRSYARQAPLVASEILDQMAVSYPDPITIQTVMRVRQIHNKIAQINNSAMLTSEERQFTALVFAAVTNLDLDGCGRVYTTRCTRCKSIINNNFEKCEQESCVAPVEQDDRDVETCFDILIDLSDHTGTLNNCKLSGKFAEKVLNLTVEEFLAMSDKDKCLVKWKYLMERCEVRLMVYSTRRGSPLIKILSCTVANPTTVTTKL